MKNKGWLDNYKDGGKLPPIYVDNIDDPRYRAYQDSLNLHNAGYAAKLALLTGSMDLYGQQIPIMNKAQDNLTKYNKQFPTFIPDSIFEQFQEPKQPVKLKKMREGGVAPFVTSDEKIYKQRKEKQLDSNYLHDHFQADYNKSSKDNYIKNTVPYDKYASKANPFSKTPTYSQNVLENASRKYVAQHRANNFNTIMNINNHLKQGGIDDYITQLEYAPQDMIPKDHNRVIGHADVPFLKNGLLTNALGAHYSQIPSQFPAATQDVIYEAPKAKPKNKINKLPIINKQSQPYQPKQIQTPSYVPKDMTQEWYSNKQGVPIDADNVDALYNEDGTRKYKNGGKTEAAKPSPYQDMDPAMLQGYQQMERQMQMLSTPEGQRVFAGELYQKDKKKKASEAKIEDNDTRQRMKDKAAQQRVVNDPSMFNPSFWKEDPMTGRTSTQRLEDMGTDLQTRVFQTGNKTYDSYLNGPGYIAHMAGNLAKAPAEAKRQNSVMPYVNALVEPLAIGAGEKLIDNGIKNVKLRNQQKKQEEAIRTAMNNFERDIQLEPIPLEEFRYSGNSNATSEYVNEIANIPRSSNRPARINRPSTTVDTQIDEFGLIDGYTPEQQEIREAMRGWEQIPVNNEIWNSSSEINRPRTFQPGDFINTNRSFNISDFVDFNDTNNGINLTRNVRKSSKTPLVERGELPSNKNMMELEDGRYTTELRGNKVTLVNKSDGRSMIEFNKKDNNEGLQFVVNRQTGEYPKISSMSFHNENPLSAGVQLHSALNLVGPQIQMASKGSTSMYSTPLFYSAVEKFAKTPGRIELSDVTMQGMNEIKKFNGGERLEQLKQQAPIIQASIEKLRKTTGIDMPDMLIQRGPSRDKLVNMSIEELSKYTPTPGEEIFISTPDFKLKKHFKKGGKINNWLDKY